MQNPEDIDFEGCVSPFFITVPPEKLRALLFLLSHPRSGVIARVFPFSQPPPQPKTL
jgi:hypothetical protein